MTDRSAVHWQNFRHTRKVLREMPSEQRHDWLNSLKLLRLGWFGLAMLAVLAAIAEYQANPKGLAKQ